MYVNHGLSVGIIAHRLGIPKMVVHRVITKRHLKHIDIKERIVPPELADVHSKLDNIYRDMANWSYDDIEYVAENYKLSKEEVEYVIETFKLDGRWTKIEENVKAFMDYYPGGI